ncbi:hypothetical protein JOC27_001280 [Sporolactobacillus spathodeae]|uniref:Uncharacterized protein n=1 Tax=Sporolactobacillus spathodeae TaxID=1465502 RepID=A0ABS2Q923_9BACL|nr:hypothetical protein [Sporolactobacillus spathodeae]
MIALPNSLETAVYILQPSDRPHRHPPSPLYTLQPHSIRHLPAAISVLLCRRCPLFHCFISYSVIALLPLCCSLSVACPVRPLCCPAAVSSVPLPMPVACPSAALCGCPVESLPFSLPVLCLCSSVGYVPCLPRHFLTVNYGSG